MVNKKIENNVNEYIANSPNGVQVKLRKIRTAILEIAPDAIERTDYFQIPGYSYEGYDYHGMFAWFSYKGSIVRLHIRPPVLQEHKRQLAGYATTKGILSFPVEGEIPIALVKKLVKASIKVMRG